MGYRNYFYIADKEKVNEFLMMNKEQQVRATKQSYDDEEDIQRMIEWEGIDCCRFNDWAKAEEIHECGKYFDSETRDKLIEGDEVQDLSTEDSEFFICLKPEALLICAEHYKQNTITWYSKLIKSMDMTDEEIKADWNNYMNGRPDIKSELIFRLRDLEGKFIDILNTDIEDNYHITTSWSYEYVMFELVHLYKTIDWSKYYLIWCGY